MHQQHVAKIALGGSMWVKLKMANGALFLCDLKQKNVVKKADTNMNRLTDGDGSRCGAATASRCGSGAAGPTSHCVVLPSDGQQ